MTSLRAAWYSPNSITPTLRQSPGQVPNKVADLSRTQITTSPPGSFGESWRNGIWAYATYP